MRIVPINPADPRQDRLEAATRTLAKGQLVVIPTETFYGLAGDATNPKALARINRIKKKPADAPILAFDRVVLTPHAADQTPEAVTGINEGAVENVIAFLEGRPQNVVEP